MGVEMTKGMALDLVRSAAQQSYGSGALEGAKGGAGAVGMIGGKVVKFNTHWLERRGAVTDDMVASSNELRKALGDAARALAGTGADQTRHLQGIFAKLGLTAQGTLAAGQGLLSRKVVAQVAKAVDDMRLANGTRAASAFDGVKAASSKGVDTRFATLSGKPTLVRNAVLEAVRGEFGDKIPLGLETALFNAGVRLDGHHSTLPLEKDKLDAVIKELDRVRTALDGARRKDAEQSARDKLADMLTGKGMADLLKPEKAKALTTTLLGEAGASFAKESFAKDTKDKVAGLVGKLTASGADPTKVLRLAGVLTAGLDKMVAAYFAKHPDKLPPAPKEVAKPLFMSGFLSNPEKVAAYTQYVKDREKWVADCDAARSKFTTPVLAACSRKLAPGGKPNDLVDALMTSVRQTAEELEPGLFDKTAGDVLGVLDARLRQIARTDRLAAASAKADAGSPAAMFKLDLATLCAKMEGLVKGKLADFASVKGLRVEPGPAGSNAVVVRATGVKITDKTIKFLKGNNVPETLINALSNEIGDISIPLSFGLDGQTGKLSLTIGRLSSETFPMLDLLNGVPLFLKDVILGTLAEKLGGTACVEGRKAEQLTGLDKIEAFSGKGTAPIEISMHENPTVAHYVVKLDPAAFAPLASLGLPADTKLTDLVLNGAGLSVQAGGRKGALEAFASTRGAVAAQVHLGAPQLDLLRDEAVKAMKANGVRVDDLRITTSGADGTVRVDLANLDASGAIKGHPKIGKLATGSYAIVFKPQLDPKTGEMLLSIKGVESKTNVAKKRALNAGLRVAGFIAGIALAGNPDVTVERPERVAPGEKPYLARVRLNASGLVKYAPQLDRGDGLPSVRPTQLKVTDEGITLGAAGDL